MRTMAMRSGRGRAAMAAMAAALALVGAGCEEGGDGPASGGAPAAADLVACLSDLDIGLVVDEASGAASADEPGAAPEAVDYVITAQGVVEENLDANIFGTALLASTEEDVDEAVGLLEDLETSITGAADSEGVQVDGGSEGRYGWLLAAGPDAIAEDVDGVRGCIEP